MADPAMQADELLSPQPQQLVAGEVRKEDLQGTFSVHLRVNPDLPYDRSVLLQLGQFLLPYMAERYPIGARLLLRKIWTIQGQGDFDAIYPEAIALLETQRLMARVLAETQQMQMQMQLMQAQAQAASQPQGPQGPSPETQQAMEGALQAEAQGKQAQAQAQVHGAEHTQQRNEMQTAQQRQAMEHETAQQHVKLLQQLEKLRQQRRPPASNGREE